MREFVEKESVLFSDNGTVIGKTENPVIFEVWTKEQKIVRRNYSYTKVVAGKMETIAEAEIEDEYVGRIQLLDRYEWKDEAIIWHRVVRVLEESHFHGLRLCTEWELFPGERNRFEDFRYFAPPAIFDKNDLDEDGYEDYFHTKKTVFRDDRFNYPIFTSFFEKHKTAVRIEREKLPAFDSIPDREETAQFLQKTDIGSMGVDGSSGHTKMIAYYPFFEGDATIGLQIVKRISFGAFWPLKKGEEFEVSYRLSCTGHEDFHEACWYGIREVIQKKHPIPPALVLDPEELVRLRLEALDRYYVEKDSEEDENRPAGYVLNCHPQDGQQLENIIQYGFTGQNILNALNVLRYGYEKNDAEYCRKAVRIADFFADVIHIKETGMFYNLYNVDQKKVNFWWTGLLLPLAYATGTKLQELMGPLYDYRRDVIEVLTKLEGAYLRCMNEDATALLRIYLLEKEKGKEHGNWKEAVLNYAGFLLRTQEDDGGWYRAYDLDAQPLLKPEKWFGSNVYEQKSSTGTTITFLTELYRMTGEKKYLNAAIRAGRFVRKYIIDRVRFCGGVHDSIYAKGELIDNESILYPMFGMLSLYETTGEKEFLVGAHRAARFFASWVCLWDVPLPKGSTLEKYGFSSVGMGACDTCGCGYVHPFQLMGVAELAQIAIYAKDPELFETARLYWYGCNQTVESGKKSWGYALPGLQEEGYLISWWAVDDPMFGSDTGFGKRWKGEGNKTCFPWINAVGVRGYWALLDRFKTVDFSEIYQKYF